MSTAAPPEGLAFDRIPTPAGEALVIWDGDLLLRVFDWAGHEARMHRLLARHYGPVEPKSAPAPKWLKDVLRSLDLIRCATGGTPFQRAVWAALRDIPVGTTITYGGLARRIGRPAAVRAVGLANGANPIGLVVPCHRVIGADGSLTGYAGGIERKRWLLRHEGVTSQNAVGHSLPATVGHRPRCSRPGD
jgi:methylated-DNA-[protein]-cysteine S-methyltransferase